MNSNDKVKGQWVSAHSLGWHQGWRAHHVAVLHAMSAGIITPEQHAAIVEYIEQEDEQNEPA